MLADQFPQNTQFKIICQKCPESCKLNKPVNEKLSAQEFLTAWAGHFEAALKSFCAYTVHTLCLMWNLFGPSLQMCILKALDVRTAAQQALLSW